MPSSLFPSALEQPDSLSVVRLPVFLLLVTPVLAQRGDPPVPSRQVAVPFVGCVAQGQLEDFEAPTGAPRATAISPKNAQQLAYYKAAIDLGVLAPRGWHCEGSSGSSGDALWLSPEPINRHAPGWNGFAGPAIEIYHISSGASTWQKFWREYSLSTRTRLRRYWGLSNDLCRQAHIPKTF